MLLFRKNKGCDMHSINITWLVTNPFFDSIQRNSVRLIISSSRKDESSNDRLLQFCSYKTNGYLNNPEGTKEIMGVTKELQGF